MDRYHLDFQQDPTQISTVPSSVRVLAGAATQKLQGLVSNSIRWVVHKTLTLQSENYLTHTLAPGKVWPALFAAYIPPLDRAFERFGIDAVVRPVTKWVSAIRGPLGESIPRRWRTRVNRDGHHDIWVICQQLDKYVVWRWQINRSGKARKAAYPTVVASSLWRARAAIPYGLTSEDCDAEPSLGVLEIWY